MSPLERQEAMADSESLPEILSHACGVSMDKARDLQSRINSIESFFEDHGFSRGKPRKMAIMYIMMRYGHTPRSVELWWGVTDSSYDSFSADIGKDYLQDIKTLINEEVEDSSSDPWTAGDEVYESSEDPLDQYFDIQDEGRNAKITSFGE